MRMSMFASGLLFTLGVIIAIVIVCIIFGGFAVKIIRAIADVLVAAINRKKGGDSK
jgi:hypothetical protein